MLKKIFAGTVLSLGLMANAQATFIEQSAEVGYTNTDFSDIVMTFEQFNDFGGARILDSVEFTLSGDVFSIAQVENFSSNSASSINVLISALLSLESSLGDSLVTTLPSLSRTFNATRFDGVADFAGTSGKTFSELYASNFNTRLVTDQNILSLFTGDGFVDTFLSATADTRATGGGNIFSGFETNAAGYVDVVYNYTLAPEPEPELSTPVPEPSGVMLMGAGLFGLAAVRRKKTNVKR